MSKYIYYVELKSKYVREEISYFNLFLNDLMFVHMVIKEMWLNATENYMKISYYYLKTGLFLGILTFHVHYHPTPKVYRTGCT